MDTQDQQQKPHIDPASPNASPIPKPRRPRPDGIGRVMRLTPDEIEQYDAWRFVRSIQRYWRERERELRPPTLLLIGRALLAVRRWWNDGMRGER